MNRHFSNLVKLRGGTCFVVFSSDMFYKPNQGKERKMKRREFLAASVGVAGAMRARGEDVKPADTVAAVRGAFALPPLPFAENALEPFISARTLGFHHGKHHKT